jgi:hypothetical protein
MDASNSKNACHSLDASNSRNESNNMTANTVWMLSKERSLQKQ